MVLLQTILFLIIVYYVLKIIWKWAAPRLLNYAVQKTGERFSESFGQTQGPSNDNEKRWRTTTKKGRNPRANPTKKVGEYIDFEEIE